MSNNGERWEDSLSGSAGGVADLRNSRRRREAPSGLNVDRLPPHNPEAEQGVIGCILLSPTDCLDQVIEVIGENSEPFYELRHQTIYDCMVEMHARGEPIDVITVQSKLKDRQLLEQVGGIPYLNVLQDGVPSAANVTYYAELMKEKWQLRRLIQSCTDIVGNAYSYEGEVPQLLDESERNFLQAVGDRQSEGFRHIGEAVQDSIQDIENSMQRNGEILGLSSGFPDFDRMTNGFLPGNIYIIAARPSMGKSALMMNFIETISIRHNLASAVFSLEMTKRSLTTRQIASMARVNLRAMREGFVPESALPRLTNAAGRVRNAPIFVDDTPSLSVMQMRARARRLKQRHDIKFLAVDYLQLAQSTTKRARDNRQIEIAEISSGLKALGKELDIPVVVLSQLNRSVEKEKRRPRLSDLRESGAIEQDADLVGLLHRPGANDEDEDAPPQHDDAIPTTLIIGKQREGPTGDVNLTFLKAFTRFESAARVSNEDVPTQ